MRRPKRSLAIKLLLVFLPLWLLGSGAGAMWYYFHKEKKDALVERERFAKAVSVPMLADDLRKIVEVIGERNGASAEAGANLRRGAAMIEGVLGPSNTGYTVNKSPSTTGWPLLEISLAGKTREAPGVWVLAAYDSPAGSRGGERNASGLAAVLAAAQALARDKPAVPVHFLFVPHAEESGPAAETIATKIAEMVAGAKILLCVEAMAGGEELWVSSGDSSALIPAAVAGLGKIYSPAVANPGSAQDLTNRLLSLRLPALRVSTRAALAADEPDDRVPFAPTVAASAGRLVEMIRRHAQN